MSKQMLAHWVMDVITTAYSKSVLLQSGHHHALFPGSTRLPWLFRERWLHYSGIYCKYCILHYVSILNTYR